MTNEQTTTEGQGGGQADNVSGRERGRRCLIEPLERDGMIRDPRGTAKGHAEFLAKLQDRLGYMTEDGLERLRQVAMMMAGGKAKNVWPGWVTLRNFAHRFETPPDPANPIFQTWLHSVEGPVLRSQGLHVAAYRFLVKHPRPLFPVDMREIAAAAEDDARRLTRANDALARGDILPSERAWLTDHLALTRHVEALIDAGIAHREAQASDHSKGEAA